MQRSERGRRRLDEIERALHNAGPASTIGIRHDLFQRQNKNRPAVQQRLCWVSVSRQAANNEVGRACISARGVTRLHFDQMIRARARPSSPPWTQLMASSLPVSSAEGDRPGVNLCAGP